MPHMPKTKSTICYHIGQYIVLFILLSFAGWAVETVFCSLLLGGWCDRGFLHLPFCTIYGFTILGMYGLLGTPGQGGLLLKYVTSRPLRVLLYFLLAAGLTTATELVTGVFFTEVCGLSLWDYSGYRFHYNGYICLEFFFVWGVLFLIGMGYVFEPLKRWVGRIPGSVLLWSSAICCMIVIADWIISYAEIFRH